MNMQRLHTVKSGELFRKKTMNLITVFEGIIFRQGIFERIKKYKLGKQVMNSKHYKYLS